MSDNALVHTAGTSTAIERAISPVIGPLKLLAEFFAGFNMLPKNMSVADAMIAACAGARFGLDPMTSLTAFHVVEGKPIMAADAMAGFIMSHPMCKKWRWVESNAQTAMLEVQRNDGSDPIQFGYTHAEAKKAGLSSRKNWERHTAAMLRARATTIAGRAVFPDVIFGLYSREEMADSDVIEAEFIEAPIVARHPRPTSKPPAAQTQPARPAAQSVKPEPVEESAAGRAELRAFIAQHDLGDAIELYWDARGADEAEHQSLSQIDAWPHDQAATFLAILQRVRDAGPDGAATFLAQALGRDLEAGDMERLTARIEWAARGDAEGWPLAFAQALLAEKCVRSPSTLHLRCEFPKPEKGGEA